VLLQSIRLSTANGYVPEKLLYKVEYGHPIANRGEQTGAVWCKGEIALAIYGSK